MPGRIVRGGAVQESVPGNRFVMAEWLESVPFITRVTSLNPARAALQKSNMYEITLLAEDHEPSIGIMCEPLRSPTDNALYSSG